jgi:hypothetical protein
VGLLCFLSVQNGEEKKSALSILERMLKSRYGKVLPMKKKIQTVTRGKINKENKRSRYKLIRYGLLILLCLFLLALLIIVSIIQNINLKHK